VITNLTEQISNAVCLTHGVERGAQKQYKSAHSTHHCRRWLASTAGGTDDHSVLTSAVAPRDARECTRRRCWTTHATPRDYRSSANVERLDWQSEITPSFLSRFILRRRYTLSSWLSLQNS